MISTVGNTLKQLIKIVYSLICFFNIKLSLYADLQQGNLPTLCQLLYINTIRNFVNKDLYLCLTSMERTK